MSNPVALIEQITGQSNELNAAMKTYIGQNNEFRGNIQSNLEEIKTLVDSLSPEGFLKNKEEFEKNSQDLAATRAELETRTNELKSIQEQLEQLTQSQQNLSSQIKDLEQQKNQCEQEKTQLTEQATNATTNNEAIQRQLDELNAKLLDIEQDRNNAQNQLIQQTGQLEALTKSQQDIIPQLTTISQLIQNQLEFIQKTSGEVSNLDNYNTVISHIKETLQDTINKIRDIPAAVPTTPEITSSTTETEQMTFVWPDTFEEAKQNPQLLAYITDQAPLIIQFDKQSNSKQAQQIYMNLKGQVEQGISRGGRHRYRRSHSSNKNKTPHKYGSVRQRRHRKKSTKRNRSHSGGYTYSAESAELQQSSQIIAETKPRKTRKQRSRNTSRTKTHSKKQ